MKILVFQIYCKPFDDEINGMLQQVFKVDKVYSYPTTIALLPNNLLKIKRLEIFLVKLMLKFQIMNLMVMDIMY